MIVSIHRYDLATDATEAELRSAFEEATQRNLFDLPGLVQQTLLRGIKGDGAGDVGALWVYESRTAWEAIWGPPEDPTDWGGYPEEWQTWESELLDPLLADHPDEITYTSFEAIAGTGTENGHILDN